MWTLYYVAICHVVKRRPAAGVAAARESLRIADDPTARSMARYALGPVIKKTEPDAALALFEDAGTLAHAVRNFWWHGIAQMETAATRGVHGDAARACAEFLDVLDHWDRVGDWTQQWLNLRYVTRLLARLGADGDALALHRCLVAVGKPSPLRDVDPPDVAANADVGGRRHVARPRRAEISPLSHLQPICNRAERQSSATGNRPYDPGGSPNDQHDQHRRRRPRAQGPPPRPVGAHG